MIVSSIAQALPVASIEYTPYGRIHTVDGAPGSGIDRTNIAAVSPFLFSTKYLDAELTSGGGGGLYYYGYRYYDPATGNWLNRDPIAEAGGLNLYAFVKNDPVNMIDPLGLASVTSLTNWNTGSHTYPDFTYPDYTLLDFTPTPMIPKDFGDPSVKALVTASVAAGTASTPGGFAVATGVNSSLPPESQVDYSSPIVQNFTFAAQYNRLPQDWTRLIPERGLIVAIESSSDEEKGWARWSFEFLAGEAVRYRVTYADGSTVIFLGNLSTLDMAGGAGIGAGAKLTGKTFSTGVKHLAGESADVSRRQLTRHADEVAVPDRLVRVVPEGINPTTLGRLGAADVFVTIPSDIAGMNATQIARRLAIPESSTGFRLIEFSTPRSGLASPILRTDPGFIGGGRTMGGAREFVIPNLIIPDDAIIRTVR